MSYSAREDLEVVVELDGYFEPDYEGHRLATGFVGVRWRATPRIALVAGWRDWSFEKADRSVVTDPALDVDVDGVMIRLEGSL